jgi:hypothetical protein
MRDGGKREVRKWAASFATVRVVTFLFIDEIVLLQSLTTVGVAGSQLGRWSTSSSASGDEGVFLTST